MSNPDTDYADDRALDSWDWDPANRTSSPARPSPEIPASKLSNPDTYYADDKALDRLIESWEAEKDGTSSPAASSAKRPAP